MVELLEPLPDEPAEASAPLSVDPTLEAPSMESIDRGDAGRAADERLAGEFGQKTVERARSLGWNESMSSDPVSFIAAQVAESAVAQRFAPFEAQQREQRAQARKQLESDWLERLAIAGARGEDLNALLDQRDRELARFDQPASDTRPSDDNLAPETRAFFDKYTFLRTPQNPQEVAEAAYAMNRAAELEAKFPHASLRAIYTQIGAELDRRGATKPAPPAAGRDLHDSRQAAPVRSRDHGFNSSEISQLRNQFAAMRETFDNQVYKVDAAKAKAGAAGFFASEDAAFNKYLAEVWEAEGR